MLLESTWQARLAANPSLFNGAKFRFADAVAENDGVMVHLGVTDYRSFLGTNCAPHWQRLLDASFSTLASPLGNAVVLETADDRVVLLQRGGSVGEVPNSVVMPGGHPEPGQVGVPSVAAWLAGDAASAIGWEARVRHELWDGMVREIEEETGIPRATLQPLRCIGFCRRRLNHRPDIIFYGRCALSAVEVRVCAAICTRLCVP
jgi:hypothetical protein